MTIDVYPNPAIDEIFLDLGMIKDDQLKVQIMTIDGKLVFSQTILSRNYPLYRIPMQGWTSGRYIVQIENESMRISKKIVKK